ncbi:MAG: AI-2E family transporter [Clostridiales bacterium]|nr:AI-2E family transporter [Clostridiales bacterium]
MKREKYQSYICWGVTAFVVLALLAGLVFTIMNWARVKALWKVLFNILSPVIFGAVFAYLLSPVYNYVRRQVERLLDGQLGALAGTLASVVLLLAVVAGLISILTPELVRSISSIVESMPAYALNLQNWLGDILENNPELDATVMDYYSRVVQFVQDWVNNTLIPNAYNIIYRVSSSLMSVFSFLWNAVLGLIVMVYLLNMKQKLIVQGKMIVYSILPLRIANKVIGEVRYAHQIFGGFITGKLLDSLIIGILSFVVLSFMKMPYVLLVSVVVGVTNVIPFFGPFIGAIPCTVLILLASPLQGLYFVLFILVLQQIDGNIIGPKILGNSTGLSSFWVLFAILLFGGLFGFVGMIIGVPTFAVIYNLIRELVLYLLGRRELSADMEQYEELDYIDERQKTYIRKEK